MVRAQAFDNVRVAQEDMTGSLKEVSKR
ncbi:3f6a35c6-41f8-45ea-b03f-6797aee4cc57 [Thermothielavioides terrestris]|uniref:3f6a35c6-41f8-45ea-b03f-6797aee4cc57 n=1 Tax=Thermothielavioides terrestris TaxID=2587410 RepID=A0A446BF03_9PEZI|nr:3f6a35c6-41f8-45ea-b03f-6797aee4cc57 [Thermothielavioides terrestris]